MSEPPTPEQPSGEHNADEDLVGALAEDFLVRYRRGERPSPEEYIEKHPALADDIRELFAAMLTLEQSGSRLYPGLLSEQVGAVIGGYKLLERIGEGGFGVVFMAEQTHPIRRKVALKVIKPGVDTRQVIARFEAERQALAMMDHDNIAKVFEAGATESGRPFFVMELVQGVPITEYCDRNHLAPRERLELFVQVCRAVQHAHTKGIIHRDIKPTNVLVTLHDGVPFPKVIDFGIAKATGQQLTEKTLFTNFAQMVGTPLYMSPEQAEMSGLDADTRSDIYSLGVVLYELLTGTTPVDEARLKQAAFDEVRRIIREELPPRPSTRLSTMSQQTPGVSAQRMSELKKLGLLMRGELDWIVMKCLEKERTRRYESASLLAMDVQRHLNDEPVEASPPSALYRFRKFARRNKGQVISVATIFVVLLAGIVGTTMGMIGQASQRAIAERQRLLAEAGQREAEQQTALALAVVRFQFDMFVSPSPFQSGDKVTVLEVMNAAVKKLDAGTLKDQPLAEANVRDMIGGTFHELGRYAEAETVLRKGLALRRSASASPWWIARSIAYLASTLQELGKFDEAEALKREVLQLRRGNLRAGDPLIADSAQSLGMLLQVQGKYAEAESLCREALAIRRQAVPIDELHVASTLGKLGWLLQIEEKFDEAEALCREALDIRRRNLPAAHPNVAESLNHLAVVLARTGRLAESEPLFREMLEIDRKSLPAGHPRIGQDVTNLAIALQEQGKLDEAEPLHREGLRLRRDSLPAGHIYIAQSLESLAALLRRQGKFAESEMLTREALASRRNGLPPGHPDIADAVKNLGLVLLDQGKFAQAEAALLEAEQILAAAPDLPRSTHDRCVEALVEFYAQWHASSPGKGYDLTASHWQRQLPATRPATTTSSTSGR